MQRSGRDYLSEALRATSCTRCAAPKRATRDDHCHLHSTHLRGQACFGCSRCPWPSRAESPTNTRRYAKETASRSQSNSYRAAGRVPRKASNRLSAHSAVQSLRAMGYVRGVSASAEVYPGKLMDWQYQSTRVRPPQSAKVLRTSSIREEFLLRNRREEPQ